MAEAASNAPLVRQQPGGCWSRLGKTSKICIGCSVCTVVIAAVLIPVGLLVIAPKLAQHILDTSVISLPNATMNPCNTLEAWFQNQVGITLSAPLSSTLHAYTQSVSTTTCGSGSTLQGGYACADPNVTLLGTYTAPAMELSNGVNNKEFGVRMDIENLNTILSGFMLPMFLPTHGNKARMILDAQDVAISVLGIKMTGLTMHKELTCTGEKIMDPVAIPNWVCYPKQPSHAGYTASGYYMSCVSGDLSLTTSTTTITTTTTTTKPSSAAAALVV